MKESTSAFNAKDLKIYVFNGILRILICLTVAIENRTKVAKFIIKIDKTSLP